MMYDTSNSYATGGGKLQVNEAYITAAATCHTPFSVGFRVVSLPGGPRTAVWYPSLDREKPYTYAPNLIGAVATGGRVSECGRFPLVIFSHGMGGCGIQSVFLTEELARFGYIVVAPDHSDALLCSIDSQPRRSGVPGVDFLHPEKWTDRTAYDRREDIEQVLNWMLSGVEWKRYINAGSVGIVGHSTGGYAAAAMLGAWPSWTDTRIKAAVLLSPYVQPFMVKNTLGNIRAPVMYQGAQLDVFMTPFLKGQNGAYDMTGGPTYYAELFGGSHFEWTNLLCAGQPDIARCLQTNTNARLIDAYTIGFFERYLKSDDDMLNRLRGSGLSVWKHD